jgi:hypothetical protein
MTEPVGAWGEHSTVEELLRQRLGEAVGGWRGALDAAVPTLAFTLAWLATENLRTALLASVAGLVAVVLVRVVRRESLRHIASAAVGVALAAFFAARSGRAEDIFLPGIMWNAAFGALSLISVLVRWPMLGFVVAAADPADLAEDPFRWRRHGGIVRVASALTWVFVGLYAVRLAVMVPLYLQGHVSALGVSKVALGWPAYLLALTIMGVILVRGNTPLDEPT